MKLSLIILVIMFIFVKNQISEDDPCDDANFRLRDQPGDLVPKKVKKLHPSVVLLVENGKKVVGVGTIISALWIVTIATIIQNKSRIYSICGELRDEIPINLEDVPLYNISEFVHHQDYDESKGEIHRGNVILGKLAQHLNRPMAILAWFKEHDHRCPRHYESIYFVIEDKNFVKYQLNWVPKARIDGCGDETNYFCGVAKNTLCPKCPCAPNTVSRGSPLIVQSEVRGVLAGYEGTGTCHRFGSNKTQPIPKIISIRFGIDVTTPLSEQMGPLMEMDAAYFDRFDKKQGLMRGVPVEKLYKHTPISPSTKASTRLKPRKKIIRKCSLDGDEDKGSHIFIVMFCALYAIFFI